MSNEIIVKSSIVAKKAPGLKNIQQKAVAGLSEAELIERHTIGQLEEEDKKDEEGEEASKEA